MKTAEDRTTWLIDKSALTRLERCLDPDIWADRIDRGLVHVTTLTLLEVILRPVHQRQESAELRGCLPALLTTDLLQVSRGLGVFSLPDHCCALAAVMASAAPMLAWTALPAAATRFPSPSESSAARWNSRALSRYARASAAEAVRVCA